MPLFSPAEPEVFTVHEIARAAGAPVTDVRAFLESDHVPSVGNRYVSLENAVELVRLVRMSRVNPLGHRQLFAPPQQGTRRGGVPLVASGALHAGILAVMVLITNLGLRSAPAEQRVQDVTRLVFLATPGPGGGGGGGGLRQPLPPPKAALKGTSRLRSPVVVTKRVEQARREVARRVETPVSPVPVAEPDPPPPAPVPPEPTPPVVAPVVSSPADTTDHAGVVTDTSAATPSNGSGIGGGTGNGRGTGSGPGDGAGIGDGSIAGTGGGPYRPGSGITPPAIQREVKPTYTEEGRRRSVEGDVVMEVVVRADGSVGTVKILQGLGSGLDQRAVEAVRQWRFSPARRFGTAVDVLVEIAVEFRLR